MREKAGSEAKRRGKKSSEGREVYRRRSHLLLLILAVTGSTRAGAGLEGTGTWRSGGLGPCSGGARGQPRGAVFQGEALGAAPRTLQGARTGSPSPPWPAPRTGGSGERCRVRGGRIRPCPQRCAPRPGEGGVEVGRRGGPGRGREGGKGTPLKVERGNKVGDVAKKRALRSGSLVTSRSLPSLPAVHTTHAHLYFALS